MNDSWRPGQMLRRLTRQVLERRLVPWLLAYLAGAWVLLEATSWLAAQFGWPPALLRILPVILAFGIPSVITLAWFHGKAGWQRVRVRELAIHGVIAAALCATLWTGSVMEPPVDTGAGDPSLRRIAVLYFKDHTQGELATLSRDLTEGVVHELAQVASLDVLPLTSVAPFRDTVALSRVVRELGVGSVVEGSVSRQGDSVRVIAQLVDAVPETHFGSWELLVSRDDAGRAARQLSREVADSIRIALGQAVRTQELEAAASSRAALELYRRARAVYEQEAATDWRDDRAAGLQLLAQADSLLAEAQALDPRWSAPPLLRSMIAADRSLLTVQLGERSLEDLREGVRHATRALAAGSDSAAALEQRGKLRFAMAEYSPAGHADSLMAAAERDLRAATRRDAQRPEALMALSDLKEREGNFRAALTYARRAVEADAFLEFGSGVLESQVSTMLQLRDLDGARQLNDLARRRYPGDQRHLISRLLILGSYPEPGDREIRQAWAAADTLADLGLTEREYLWRAYGHMYVAAVIARAGLADSADAVARRARQGPAREDVNLQAALSYPEARVRLVMGQEDSALALLRRYADAYPSRAPSLISDWWFQELWDAPQLSEISGTTPVPDGP